MVLAILHLAQRIDYERDEGTLGDEEAGNLCDPAGFVESGLV